jgi:hypothetical protein
MANAKDPGKQVVLVTGGSRTRPEDVADTVARVLAAPRPALRYAVGGQARLLPFLKAVMP